MSTDPEYYGLNDRTVARQKASIPGILLIIVGIVNVLLAGYIAFGAVIYYRMSLAEFETNVMDRIRAMPAFQQQFAQGQVLPAEQLKRTVTATYAGLATTSFLAAVLVIFAGASLRALRAYGLALAGALVASVPCISCLGCCGAGEIAGIWALVVLMDTEVREAFR